MALKVIRKFDEDGEPRLKDKRDGDVECKNKTKKDASHPGLKEMDKYIEQLELLNNTLTAKGMKSNYELQDARKVSIKVSNTEYCFLNVIMESEGFDIM